MKDEKKEPAGMSAALRKQCEKVKGLLRQEAMGRYEIGVIVNEITAKENTYGSRAVEKLAEVVGLDASTLYEYGKVAERWGKGEVTKMLKTGRFSWTHLVEISKVKDQKERASFVKQTQEERLSVRDVKRRISPPAEEDEGDEAADAGVAAPVQTRLRDIVAVKDHYQNRAPSWEKTFEQIEQSPDRTLEATIAAARTALQEMADDIATKLKRLDEIEAKIRESKRGTRRSA